MINSKKCSKCHIIKEPLEFYLRPERSIGLSSRCKQCLRRPKRRYVKHKYATDEEYRESKLEYARNRYRNSEEVKEKNWASSIRTRFGVTKEQYHNMLINQGYGCAICGRKTGALGKRLSIDHDHTTNKVRGLLCNRCNSYLGYISDDIRSAEKIVVYLQND